LSESVATILLLPPAGQIVCVEDTIPRLVLSGKFEAGILSPEQWETQDGNRMEKGGGGDRSLYAVADLPAAWTKATGHPLPLTLLAIRRAMDPELKRRAARVLRRACEYADAHREEGCAHAASLRRNLKIETARALIEPTLAESGVQSEATLRAVVEAFFERAERKGLVWKGIAVAFEGL
jgi:predicted solute-binding protein